MITIILGISAIILAATLVGIVASIPIIILIIMLIVQVKNWRLYLTKTAIYYHAASITCLGGHTMIIPLSCIEEISVAELCEIYPNTVYVGLSRRSLMVIMDMSPNLCHDETTWCGCF